MTTKTPGILEILVHILVILNDYRTLILVFFFGPLCVYVLYNLVRALTSYNIYKLCNLRFFFVYYVFNMFYNLLFL